MTSHPIIFSGSSNPHLAEEIVTLLGLSLGKIKLDLFPDRETTIEILEPVQFRDIFVIQSIFPDPNNHLMELLLILDALKRSAAKSITVIIPYYGYARQDRIDKPQTPISAKLVANLLTISGADRVITMDLHSEQIEGFFDIPVEHILSRSLLIPYCKSLALENPIVIAPDKGGIKIAVAYAKQLGFPVGLIEKVRRDPFSVDIQFFVGDVRDRTVVLPDDMCSTGGTLIKAAYACQELGAKRIIAIVGHGLFIQDAMSKIEESPIELMITTNSVAIPDKIRNHPKFRIISVASLFAEGLRAYSINR